MPNDSNSNIRVSEREKARQRAAGARGSLGTVRGTEQTQQQTESEQISPAANFFRQRNANAQEQIDRRNEAQERAQSKLKVRSLDDALRNAQSRVKEIDASDILPKEQPPVVQEEIPVPEPVVPVVQDETPVSEVPQVQAPQAAVMQSEKTEEKPKRKREPRRHRFSGEVIDAYRSDNAPITRLTDSMLRGKEASPIDANTLAETLPDFEEPRNARSQIRRARNNPASWLQRQNQGKSSEQKQQETKEASKEKSSSSKKTESKIKENKKKVFENARKFYEERLVAQWNFSREAAKQKAKELAQQEADKWEQEQIASTSDSASGVETTEDYADAKTEYERELSGDERYNDYVGAKAQNEKESLDEDLDEDANDWADAKAQYEKEAKSEEDAVDAATTYSDESIPDNTEEQGLSRDLYVNSIVEDVEKELSLENSEVPLLDEPEFVRAGARAADVLDELHSLKDKYKKKNSARAKWAAQWGAADERDYQERIREQDVAWDDWTRLNGRQSTFIDQILNRQFKRFKKYYKSIKEEGIKGEVTDFDTYDRDNFDYSFDQYEDENWVKKKLRKARNNMLRRFLNPAALRIEGMYVETKKEYDRKSKKKVTLGRIRYSKRVEHTINIVRRTYDCSIYNVMQLVQLRGGIGVDINGTIAKVDPNEFKLTEDQFIELCHDIVESQRIYGHPMGIVQGKPGGVRDDTGKFVVVAKTRCFPLGYVPLSLLDDLRESPKSELHDKNVDQIQKEISKKWLNETYKILGANTGGNLMYQARAIENMMRGLMTIDGYDPAKLGIPAINQRQTLMALRAEQAMTSDPDIKRANELKARRIEQEYDRVIHRFKKDNGTRSADGQIHSPASMDDRWRGRAFNTINMLQRACQAAHIAIKITNIPEEMVGRFEQNVAIHWADAAFRHVNPEVAEAFRFTPELEEISQTRAAIEARETAEALYRLGGHDLMDMFFYEKDDSGRARNRLMKTDLRRFMKEWGIINPDGTVVDRLSDRITSVLKLSPEQQASFAANAGFIFDALSGSMLGSDLFKKSESSQFVHMSMAEMARASMRNEEAYNSFQVAEWGRGSTGGEEMIRSLLMTEAGREAFMTQGLTSLGRKSPIEHGMRLAMQKNGLTEFAFRNMIDRFPEYGVNKLLRMVPFSNTICYLTSYGIKGIGDLIRVRNEGIQREEGQKRWDYIKMGSDDSSRRARMLNYQAGSRMSFDEGLRKNLMYDTVMAGGKLLIGALYCGILTLLGGVFPPDDEKDKYNWSEWKIGNDENATPMKWAWFMDDLSGVGLPLGMAWAICNQGNWSVESAGIASAVFVNAIANFNKGNVIFDAIDLVNNFDEELDAARGHDVEGYDPGFDEWFMTSLEQGFWGFIGSVTPAFVGELVPWSKSYIFAGDRDAHTVGHPETYQEYKRKKSAQTNVIQAIVDDFIFGGGYKYTDQQVAKMVDPYVQQMYDRFYLDLDPATSDLPIAQAEREQELYARAANVCEYIEDHYSNAEEAELDGFILNYDARINCINYCYHMINVAKQNMIEELTNARLSADNGYIKDEIYESIKSRFYDERERYQSLIDDFFKNEGIPWSMPKYIRQETETETRYVDDQGNPTTILNPNGHAEEYDYGSPRSLSPISQPVTEGKGYNFETLPYWLVQDANGNPVNDTAAMFEKAGNMPAIAKGRNAGMDVQELMWGGQGPNLKNNITEQMNIAPDGSPTIGRRSYRFDQDALPEAIKNLDAETASAALGIPSEISDDVMNPDVDTTGGAGAEANTKGGGNDYSKVYGDKYYGDKYYIKNYNGDRYYGYDKDKAGTTYGTRRYRSALDMYNPKIYSSDKSVYGGHAAGMSVQHPYRATVTYLRPSFSTKGSREAYERSDI